MKRPPRSLCSLPPEGAEVRGSMPACAGTDGPKRHSVPLWRGLQGQAFLRTARQEA
jgi:hypothetical protein